MDKIDIAKTQATEAVLTLGHGRGFVVEYEYRAFIARIVITAAHCLPELPPPASGRDSRDCTYKALLGPLGEEPTVWAECLFVDPVAVLGQPYHQNLYKQAEALTS
jgi:hypothetical protein